MDTPSFIEDHISQILALKLLWRIRDTNLRRFDCPEGQSNSNCNTTT